jgi:N-acetylglucosaminyl-diphospho-decaprenol L-rhamnosyltransferase
LPADAPNVHAVVVHHRGQEILSRCLETLLASTGVDLQVVVVANACLEPLPAIAEAHPRLHVLRCAAALGFAAANNKGAAFLRERCGPPAFWYFLNDDTASEPGALLALAGHMDRHPECMVAGPRLMIEGTDGLVNSLGLDLAVTGEAWDEGIGRRWEECQATPAVRPTLAVTGTALLVREGAFARLGGWEEIFHFYYEDVDLCLRARSLGGEVEVVTGAVVRHAVSATARRDSDFKRYHILRNRLLLLLMHWPGGLLLRVGPRILALELGRFLVRLGRGAWGLAWLQARAWAGLVRRLPAALRLRARRGPRHDWTAFLRPAGAIPPVRLPDPGASA